MEIEKIQLQKRSENLYNGMHVQEKKKNNCSEIYIPFVSAEEIKGLNDKYKWI